MITVKQLMQTYGENAWSVSVDDTVYKALQLMADKNVGAVLVFEEGQMVGIFSERDYARKIILMGRCSLDTQVKDIMTKDMITVDPDQNIEECMKLLTKHHIRHLPVMEKGRLVGMISMRDVVEAIITTKQDTIDNLENYILGRDYGH